MDLPKKQRNRREIVGFFEIHQIRKKTPKFGGVKNPGQGVRGSRGQRITGLRGQGVKGSRAQGLKGSRGQEVTRSEVLVEEN